MDVISKLINPVLSAFPRALGEQHLWIRLFMYNIVFALRVHQVLFYYLFLDIQLYIILYNIHNIYIYIYIYISLLHNSIIYIIILLLYLQS